MFDVKWIRENPESFDAGLGRRGITPKATALVELDRRRRVLVTDTQKLQGQRNQASKQIGAAKRDGESAEQLVKQVVALKAQLRECDREIRDIEHDIEKFLLMVQTGRATLKCGGSGNHAFMISQSSGTSNWVRHLGRWILMQQFEWLVHDL